MKIIGIKKIEDCLEGTNVRDLIFDEEITNEFIDYIGRLGKLVYKDLHPFVFFSIIVRGRYTIKSKVGTTSIRILMPEYEGGDEIIDEIIKHIELYFNRT